MANVGPAVVNAALEVLQILVSAGVEVTELRQNLDHAQVALQTALSDTDTRVALMQRIARAHESGQIPDAAYRRVVVTIARLLASSADLTTELTRITEPSRR
jgi:hypothetical protein